MTRWGGCEGFRAACRARGADLARGAHMGAVAAVAAGAWSCPILPNPDLPLPHPPPFYPCSPPHVLLPV